VLSVAQVDLSGGVKKKKRKGRSGGGPRGEIIDLFGQHSWRVRVLCGDMVSSGYGGLAAEVTKMICYLIPHIYLVCMPVYEILWNDLASSVSKSLLHTVLYCACSGLGLLSFCPLNGGRAILGK
jgi:hypothetical protein